MRYDSTGMILKGTDTQNEKANMKVICFQNLAKGVYFVEKIALLVNASF